MKEAITLVIFLSIAGPTFGQVENDGGHEVPEAPAESDFAALRKTSPFTRVLSLPGTYALRGVATINQIQVATLYNRETKKTIIVTPDGGNEAGISLVEVMPSSTLEGVAAKISFAGDEAEGKKASAAALRRRISNATKLSLRISRQNCGTIWGT